MDDDSIAKLIADHLIKKAPESTHARAAEILASITPEQLMLLNISQGMHEIAIAEEAYDLHFSATTLLWAAGLINSETITSLDDLRSYATSTWNGLQRTMQEIIDEGLSDL